MYATKEQFHQFILSGDNKKMPFQVWLVKHGNTYQILTLGTKTEDKEQKSDNSQGPVKSMD